MRHPSHRTSAPSHTHTHTHTHTKTRVSTQAILAVAGALVVTAFAVMNFTFNDDSSSVSVSGGSCLQSCQASFPCDTMTSPSDQDQCNVQAATCQRTCADIPRVSTQNVNLQDGGQAPYFLGEFPSGEYLDMQFHHAIRPVSLWQLASGSLPAGLELRQDGRLVGTPTVSETHEFVFSLNGQTTTNQQITVQNIHLIIRGGQVVANTNTNANLIRIDTLTLNDGQLGTSYSQDLHAQTNQPADSLTWSVISGALPAGLQLDRRTGTISGYPSEVGTFDFGVGVSTVLSNPGTLNQQASDRRMYKLTIADRTRQQTPDNLSIQTQNVPGGRVGQSYAFRFEASGGSQPQQWSAIGALPEGMTLASDGTFNGVPLVARRYRLAIHVEGPAQPGLNVRSQDRTFTFDVASNQAPLTILTGGLPEAREYTPWENRFAAAGGSGSYIWSMTSEAIDGMTFSQDGLLSGRPTVSGARTVHVVLRDRNDDSTTERDFVLNILSQQAWQQPPQPTPEYRSPLSFLQVGPYPDGKVNDFYYSRPFILTGGTPPYHWNIDSGRLPDGLSLAANGEIVGVPQRAGTFSFIASASDANGQRIQADRAIRILDTQDYQTQHQVYTLPPSQSSFSDADLSSRLAALRASGLNVHDLIKLQDDGNPLTQHDSTVYYLGADGRRHAFPNPLVYATWYPNYGPVRIVSASILEPIPLGANVTYRPGVRLVKFTGTPTIYVVDSGRRLRVVAQGGIAETLYGPNWIKLIDDIPDTFYTDYVTGPSLTNPKDYQPVSATQAARTPSDILP